MYYIMNKLSNKKFNELLYKILTKNHNYVCNNRCYRKYRENNRFCIIGSREKSENYKPQCRKAKELTDKGAELFTGDTGNAELLKKAFNGATAVYAMIPLTGRQLTILITR